MLFCCLQRYKDHECKPATQEHCALLAVQNKRWSDLHTVGAVPGITPSSRRREVCREAEALGGDTQRWDREEPSR